MIDVEPELQAVQVEYIKKQLKMLKEFYYNSYADVEYLKLCEAYEEQLEQAEALCDFLTLYKHYYQTACTYLFRSFIEESEPTEYKELSTVEIEGTDPPF